MRVRMSSTAEANELLRASRQSAELAWLEMTAVRAATWDCSIALMKQFSCEQSGRQGLSYGIKRMLKYFKVVVVGDAAVGKTILLTTSTSGHFSGDYFPRSTRCRCDPAAIFALMLCSLQTMQLCVRAQCSAATVPQFQWTIMRLSYSFVMRKVRVGCARMCQSLGHLCFGLSQDFRSVVLSRKRPEDREGAQLVRSVFCLRSCMLADYSMKKTMIAFGPCRTQALTWLSSASL